MASRTISTCLVIEGEPQYKQSAANINSAFGALKAALLSQIQEQQRAKVAEAQLALENARKAQQILRLYRQLTHNGKKEGAV